MQRAEIHPCLELNSLPHISEPAYAAVEGDEGILGNGFLETRLTLGGEPGCGSKFLNKVTGEWFDLHFSPLEAWFEDACYRGSEACSSAFEARGTEDTASLTMRLTFECFDIDLTYVAARGDHYFQKLMTFRNISAEGRLRQVTLFRHQIHKDHRAVLHDGGMYFPIVFLRGGASSMFYCVDFPGYFAAMDANEFRFDYYPGVTLHPGRSFQAQSAHMGIAPLTGRRHTNPYHETGAALDVGERQWFSEYLLRGSPKAPLPIAELTGREPGFRGPGALEVLDQCEWFGAKQVVLPEMLVNLDAYPLAEAVKTRLIERGVRAALVLSREATRNVRWVALAEDGAPMDPGMGACFASEEYCRSLVNQYTQLMDQHQMRNVEVRGAPIVVCHSHGHGHAPGIESLQGAFQGLVEVVAALRENGGHLCCTGPYASYGAGVARLFDSIGTVAADHPLALPDIHPARLFADMARLYTRRSLCYLLPKAKLSNSVGMAAKACPDAPYPGAEAYPWYLYHDSRGWRYGLISAIASGLRHRFHCLPQDLSAGDRAFAKAWLDWERDHVDLLAHAQPILAEPGLGPVDGFASVRANGGVIFLFNTTYDAHAVEFALDLQSGVRFQIRESYPRQRLLRGPVEGLYGDDSIVAVEAPPREALVLHVEPASGARAAGTEPAIYGAVMDGAPAQGQNAVSVCGEAGARVRVGIRDANGYREEDVEFPGGACPRHITDWSYAEAGYESGLKRYRGGFKGDPCPDGGGGALRNVWLSATFSPPEALAGYVDRTPFTLSRPCWTYDDRLFFVIRFEPEHAFDPIRTSADVPGVPESAKGPLPQKYGIDLATMNLGLKAWINGVERPVYPALAAWEGYSPNPHPVVAYFFEAGSALRYGRENRIVLFAAHFNTADFKGAVLENAPSRMERASLACTV